MVFTPDSTSSTQLLPEETAVTNFSVNALVVHLDYHQDLDFIDTIFQNAPFSAAFTPPNVQFQPPYTPFLEIPMGTYSTQAPYDAVQGVVQDSYLPLRYASHSLYALPRTTLASFDNSVRVAQYNESGLSGVDLAWSPTVVPAALQSFPSPTSTTPPWFEIPQRVYEHGNRQWDFRPSEPIPFNVYGLPGINMEDAFHKRFTGLDGRDDPVFQNTVTAISCRFLFPGYPARSAQIPTLGWRKDRVPITRSKLAYEVAKKLNRYLESMVAGISHWRVHR